MRSQLMHLGTGPSYSLGLPSDSAHLPTMQVLVQTQQRLETILLTPSEPPSLWRETKPACPSFQATLRLPQQPLSL